MVLCRIIIFLRLKSNLALGCACLHAVLPACLPTCLPAYLPAWVFIPPYHDGYESEIVERVLCKASRTTSGSDSYFTVEQLFTNSDYLLKKRSERLPPINVEVCTK